MIQLGIFRSRNVTGANLVQALIVAGMFGMFFMGALYMERVLGYQALELGLAFLPITLVMGTLSGALLGAADRRCTSATVNDQPPRDRGEHPGGSPDPVGGAVVGHRARNPVPEIERANAEHLVVGVWGCARAGAEPYLGSMARTAIQWAGASTWKRPAPAPIDHYQGPWPWRIHDLGLLAALGGVRDWRRCLFAA